VVTRPSTNRCRGALTSVNVQPLHELGLVATAIEVKQQVVLFL